MAGAPPTVLAEQSGGDVGDPITTAALARLAALALGGYLLGSIPFGVIATRLGGAGDLRAVGSGSIGATNVLRTGRRDLALITLIGDGGKGALTVLLAHLVAGWDEVSAFPVALAAGAAFLGHLFPVWLRFKGGKGVATAAAILLTAAWPVFLAAAAAWFVMAFAFRISSLAGLTAAALIPAFAVLLHQPRPIQALALFIAVMVFLRHRGNIRRLLRGEEPRIGAKTAAVAPPDSA